LPADPQPLYTASDARNPTWSPDGSWIAFSAYNDATQSYDVFITNAQPNLNENILTLTETTGIDEYRPKWSPDGEWVLYNDTSSNGTASSITMINVLTQETRTLQTATAPFAAVGARWATSMDNIFFWRLNDETQIATLTYSTLEGVVDTTLGDLLVENNIDLFGFDWFRGR
jgi:Tol biopolymer transport system component